MSMLEANKVKLSEDGSIRHKIGKGDLLAVLGTKEGKVLVYRIGTASNNKLLSSKAGVCFGAITAIDVT